MGARVQQLITQDELTAGGIEQAWVDAVIRSANIVPERLPAEITNERTDKETIITTIWCERRPVAIAIRQRDEANYTVLTLVQT